MVNELTTLKRFPGILCFVLFVIGLAGVPEDISTWDIWLKKALPLFDYLLGIITGAAVTVLVYETANSQMHLFKRIEPKADISITEVIERVWSEHWSSTFNFEEFGDVLWNSLASGRITAWGKEWVTPGYGYQDDRTLWPHEEKIPKEYWKSNKIDLNEIDFLEDTLNTYVKKGQPTYGELRFNIKQLEDAGIFNSGFKQD